MRFTLNELHALCSKYETRFNGGHECRAVRRMLTDMMHDQKLRGGAVGTDNALFQMNPTPRLTPRKQDQIIRDHKLVPTPSSSSTSTVPKVSMPSSSSTPMIPNPPGSSTSNVSKVQPTHKSSESSNVQSTRKGSTANTTHTPSDGEMYAQLLETLYSPEQVYKRYMSTQMMNYRLMTQFGFIQKGHVVQPWSMLPQMVQVWTWCLHDYCMNLLYAKTLTIDPIQMLTYLAEINDIIDNNIFLNVLPYPALRALEEKMFKTWQKYASKE